MADYYDLHVPGANNYLANGLWHHNSGKTEAASDWMDKHMLGPPCDPRLPGGHRAAIVAPTLGDAWEACVVGPSGLQMLNPEVQAITARGGTIVRWPNGAEAKLFGTQTVKDVDRLRAGGNRSLLVGTPVLTRRGWQRIERIWPGEEVWTRQGWKRVTRRWNNGWSQVWKVTLTDGKVLWADPDHKLATVGGMITAWDASPGCRLVTWQTSLSSMGSAGTNGRAVTTQTAAAGFSTDTCGSKPMGRSHPGMTSTIGTKTEATTVSTTSSWLRNQAISPVIHVQRNGTQPEAGLPLPVASLLLPNAHASNAARATGGLYLPDSAPTLALSGTTTEPVPAATTSNEPAPCVADRSRSSRVSSTGAAGLFALGTVATVEPTSFAAPVYDLEVEEAHEYVAAGVIVSNCAAWCEELSAWPRLSEAWENLDFGLRIGPHPQRVASTTPKVRTLIKDLVVRAKHGRKVALTRARTIDNPHLHPAVLERLLERYAGTRIGRQELDAELLEDVEGALWTLDMIEEFRWRGEWVEAASGEIVPNIPPLKRLGIGVDPSGGAAEIGIVVAGLGTDLRAYVLADLSLKATPAKWGQTVVDAYHDNEGDKVVAEVNYGGDLVVRNIEAIDPNVPIEVVHATRGKVRRAEPIVTKYQKGRVVHVGTFPTLEGEQTTWIDEPGAPSPNRMDAAVWVLWWLLIGRPPKRGRGHAQQIVAARIEP
jgi:phage terminase large subunit-like protein